MFRVITEGSAYRERVLLRDGTPLLLRVAGAADADLLAALYDRSSLESRQLRFGNAGGRVDPAALAPVPPDGLRLLAVTGEGAARRAVGVGEFLVLRDGRSAEVSFLVDDVWQGRGVGTLLLERLAGLAAARGVVAFRAEVSAENTAMQRMFRASGFPIHQDRDGDTLLVEFPLDDAPSLRERSDLREHLATVRSLRPLLRPRSVAVVGVKGETGVVADRLLRHLRDGGFTGTVEAVPALPGGEGELPAAELVVAAVPPGRAVTVAEAAAGCGARALLAPAVGAADTVTAHHRRLAAVCAAAGLRLLGPECLGVICNHPAVRLNASLVPALPPRGGIGFFSHSGALGLAVLQQAAARGLGFSSFVAGGLRADVSGADLLHWWCDDPDTHLVLLYLERFRDPRRFFRAARRIARRLPVLCVKSARSLAGRSAAGPGHGTFGDEDSVEALFRQAGLIRADTLDEMFDVALLLQTQPLPAGPRVAVVANSHGVATLAADACTAADLVLSGPGAVELPAGADAADYRTAVAAALAHPDVDALLVCHACVEEDCSEPVARAVDEAVAAAAAVGGRALPVLLNLMGPAGVVRSAGPTGRVFPSYLFPESAPRALGRVVRYARWRDRPAGRVPWPVAVDGPALRRRALALLDGADGPVVPDVAPDLLSAADLAVAPDSVPDVAGDLLIRSDPYFGPVLHISRGDRRAVRLAPLTDTETEDLTADLGLAPDTPAARSLTALLDRVGRLVEELPWLRELRAGYVLADAADGPAALVAPRLVLVPGCGSGPVISGAT